MQTSEAVRVRPDADRHGEIAVPVPNGLTRRETADSDARRLFHAEKLHRSSPKPRRVRERRVGDSFRHGVRLAREVRLGFRRGLRLRGLLEGPLLPDLCWL